MKIRVLFLSCGLLYGVGAFAQCGVGESEVTITVGTDMYGSEIYWELVPGGNSCGIGTIFAGGNQTVGCGGMGSGSPTSGQYASMTTITEGPWCLTTGSDYSIVYSDDYGDGGAEFEIEVDGYTIFHWSGASGSGSSGSTYTFTAAPPPPLNMVAHEIEINSYVSPGTIPVKGTWHNHGTETITSMDVSYQIDGGTIHTASLTGLSIPFDEELTFEHPTPWVIPAFGDYVIRMWTSNLNGSTDMDPSNDTLDKLIVAGPGIENLIDNYIGITPTQTVIVNASQGVAVPRDLDFNPMLNLYELWVVMKSTEELGGKTLKISNAGQGNQTELLQQDGNAWHFMSLPTGIAFGDDEFFATSPGVYDANHDGGDPYTGPTLWSSDPTIYAQPSGGNGSHMDMLHESPYSMGIAHETDNVFWVNDGAHNCVARCDFKEDHGPGNHDHSDGEIRRYTGMGLLEDPTHHVVSHMVLDKSTNWLYIVDTGNDRVVRLDITSGNQTGTFQPYEPIAETSVYGGYTVENYITTGLTEPSGIDLIENRMIVSDHSTGEIVIYDISGATGTELNRIQTGTPGIMGVKIGPDGKIWYVNASTNEVVRLEFDDATGITENEATVVTVYPNPAASQVIVHTTVEGEHVISIQNVLGQVVYSSQTSVSSTPIDVSGLETGNYIIKVINTENGTVINKKLVITH